MHRFPISILLGLALVSSTHDHTHWTDWDNFIAVPTVSGKDISLPVSGIDKIKPLGWAMILDKQKGQRGKEVDRIWKLFNDACLRNPQLESDVVRYLAIHEMMKAPMREPRGVFGGGFKRGFGRR